MTLSSKAYTSEALLSFYGLCYVAPVRLPKFRFFYYVFSDLPLVHYTTAFASRRAIPSKHSLFRQLTGMNVSSNSYLNVIIFLKNDC
jgi:hypothetical protein